MYFKVNLLPVLIFIVLLLSACVDEVNNSDGPGEPESVELKPLSDDKEKIDPIEFEKDFKLTAILPVNMDDITEEDSTIIADAMAYCGAIDRNSDLPFRKYNPNSESGTNVLHFVFKGQEIIRGIYTQRSDVLERRQRIYFKEGEMVYYRLREMNKTPGSESAREVYCFYKDGEIAKILDKEYVMEDGKINRSLSPFLQNSTKDYGEFHATIESKWEEMLSLAD